MSREQPREERTCKRLAFQEPTELCDAFWTETDEEKDGALDMQVGHDGTKHLHTKKRMSAHKLLVSK